MSIFDLRRRPDGAIVLEIGLDGTVDWKSDCGPDDLRAVIDQFPEHIQCVAALILRHEALRAYPPSALEPTMPAPPPTDRRRISGSLFSPKEAELALAQAELRATGWRLMVSLELAGVARLDYDGTEFHIELVADSGYDTTRIPALFEEHMVTWSVAPVAEPSVDGSAEDPVQTTTQQVENDLAEAGRDVVEAVEGEAKVIGAAVSGLFHGSTTEPPTTTMAPETTTAAPETTTQPPETTTQAPETTTAAPSTSEPPGLGAQLIADALASATSPPKNEEVLTVPGAVGTLTVPGGVGESQP